MKFTIPGEPCGKGRPRVVNFGGVTRTHTPQKTAMYENLVKLEFQRQCRGAHIADGPIKVRVVARYSIPKSVSKRKAEAMRGGVIRPTKKPDCDNVLKIVCDALNKLAYGDDAQIVSAYIEKWYADIPEVEVEIKEA